MVTARILDSIKVKRLSKVSKEDVIIAIIHAIAVAGAILFGIFLERL